MFSLPGIVALILNPSGRWRPLDNLPSRLFAPRKEPQYAFNGRLDALKRRKMPFLYRHLNPGYPTCRLVATTTTPHQLHK